MHQCSHLTGIQGIILSCRWTLTLDRGRWSLIAEVSELIEYPYHWNARFSRRPRRWRPRNGNPSFPTGRRIIIAQCVSRITAVQSNRIENDFSRRRTSRAGRMRYFPRIRRVRLSTTSISIAADVGLAILRNSLGPKTRFPWIVLVVTRSTDRYRVLD